jgi:glycosyltransferase involved in cell wall biosynthesis
VLDHTTPVILTFNEEANIARTLESLLWAHDIVVVDSFSTDATGEIVWRFPQVRFFQHTFESHASQWNFAIHETGVKSEWILSLDADYVVTDSLLEEIRCLDPKGVADAYSAAFEYCIYGIPLRTSLYPRVTVLFRRHCGHYVQDGHTQRLVVNGKVLRLRNKLQHDDRKPLSTWLASQDRYAVLEAEILATKNWLKLGMVDRLRRFPLTAPFGAFFYCYLLKGGILDGRAGLYYALQRMLSECLLALRLLEKRGSNRPQ